ncbi:MAG: hypothetical protein JWP91_3588 [Fibrobacteres bacterium]|nr:hypothetical protein [Fibrobacterota bacterium]
MKIVTNKTRTMTNDKTQPKTHIRGGTMRNAFLKMTVTAFAAISLMGCLNNEEETQPQASGVIVHEDQKLAFKEGHDLWTASKPPSYSYQLSRNCFCFPYGRMEVYVDADKVVKVDTIEGVEGPYDLESFHNAPNLDDVFSQVEGYLNNPDYEVKASYDAKMGYPITVKIHHLLNYVDADAEFLIASFRPQR